MSRLQDELAEVFSRHGHPSYEEPSWAAVVSIQVLVLQMMEKMMSTIQDLAQKSASEATALVDLNSSIAAFMTTLPAGTAPGVPGATVINSADQAILDQVGSQLDSNIAKIGEIKALLTTAPSGGTPPAPPITAGQVSTTPPASS